MPATINVLSTTDLTGATAFAGSSQLKGAQLAVEEINNQKFLGANTKLNLISKDTAGSPQTASSLVTEGVADKSVSAILGTVTGAQTLAVAPIAQQGKIPILFTQSGSDGTVIGDYTFRITAPMSSYYKIAVDYLKNKGTKKIAVLYTTASPTLQELGEKVLPQYAKEDGMTISESVGITNATVDFSAQISKILASKPDIVSVLLQGSQNATVATQLSQAGYTGTVLANAGASSGQLAPAAAAAKLWIWPTDFTYLDTKSEGAVAYVKAYKAKFNGDNPLNYSAEGYDSIWMLARAIKAQGSADRDKIKTGLATLAKAGFDGALGKLTFVSVNGGYDLRVNGVLVGWDGAKLSEVLVS